MEVLTQVVSTQGIPWNALLNFKLIVLSIVLEALPFIICSVLVSSILNNFVSEDRIKKFIPANKLFAVVAASLLGMLLPVCDCGMVPVVRRLLMKGVPLYAAVAFLLAAPIVNPVVAVTTFFAFHNNGSIVCFRFAMAFGIACLVGLSTCVFFKGNEWKDLRKESAGCRCFGHVTEGNVFRSASFIEKLLHTFYDAGEEFFGIGKYLIMGAMLGGLVQVVLPREILFSVGQNSYLSVIVMMVFSYAISVCSAANTFIAASFSGNFSTGALLSFMVFGPMIDLKSTCLLLYVFPIRFVIWLVAMVTFLCGFVGYGINAF